MITLLVKWKLIHTVVMKIANRQNILSLCFFSFNRTMQPVQLDSKIKLLDCPGIILPGGDASDSSAALRNAIKVETLDDPITPVDAILARADKNQVEPRGKFSVFILSPMKFAFL